LQLWKDIGAISYSIHIWVADLILIFESAFSQIFLKGVIDHFNSLQSLVYNLRFTCKTPLMLVNIPFFPE